MKWHKAGYVITALIFAALAVTVFTTGCLTPEQKAAALKVVAAQKKNKAMLTFYNNEIKLVQKMFQDGKIKMDQLKSLVNALQAKKQPFIEALTANTTALQELKDAESPWWLYAISGLGVAAGIASRVLGGRAGAVLQATADASAAALGVISRGVENHNAEAEAMAFITPAPPPGTPSPPTPRSVAKHIGIEADRIGNGTRGILEKARAAAAKHEI